MDQKKIEQFFELLNDIVNGEGSAKEKYANLKAEASESDQINLDELAEWVSEDEEAEDDE